MKKNRITEVGNELKYCKKLLKWLNYFEFKYRQNVCMSAIYPDCTDEAERVWKKLKFIKLLLGKYEKFSEFMGNEDFGIVAIKCKYHFAGIDAIYGEAVALARSVIYYEEKFEGEENEKVYEKIN